MIDFDADGAGINGAGFAGVFAFALQFGCIAGAEESEGIEVAFEVSPLTIGVEDAFPLWVGAVFDDSGGQAAVRVLGFRGHRSAGTRIKDAGQDVVDSLLPAIILQPLLLPGGELLARLRFQRLL